MKNLFPVQLILPEVDTFGLEQTSAYWVKPEVIEITWVWLYWIWFIWTLIFMFFHALSAFVTSCTICTSIRPHIWINSLFQCIFYVAAHRTLCDIALAVISMFTRLDTEYRARWDIVCDEIARLQSRSISGIYPDRYIPVKYIYESAFLTNNNLACSGMD